MHHPHPQAKKRKYEKKNYKHPCWKPVLKQQVPVPVNGLKQQDSFLAKWKNRNTAQIIIS